MKRLAAVLLAALPALLAPAVCGAVLYIDINAPGGRRMPVAVPDLFVTGGDPSVARDIADVIAGDLAMTGLFDVIHRDAYLERIGPQHFAGTPISFPDWKMIGAEAVVIGKAEIRGGQVAVEMRLYDATLGTMMAGRKYSGPLGRRRNVAHRFANEVLYAFTGVRGIFDTEIAFSARGRTSRGKEIYVIGLDGKDLRQITDNRSFNLFPRWSPDGSRIAYTSYNTGVPQIHLLDLSRGTGRALLRGRASQTPGSFSPDGRYLYVTLSSGGNSDIYRLPVDGGGLEKMAEGWGIEVSPSASPDGKRIAFVSDRGGVPQVYVKALGSRSEVRVSPAGRYSTSPSWSPAGDWIAFTTLAGGKYSVQVVRPDGTELRTVASGAGNCLDPSFSPDGRYLVYTFRQKGYSELKIVSVSGRGERSLFNGLPGAGSPAWSPRR